MKIAVYGASGTVGSYLVQEALARGHQVTALSRSASSDDSAATWRRGDLTDLAGVSKVAEEHDVVVTAHGPSREPGGDPSDYPRVIELAAQAVGSTRLLVVGGAGSLLATPDARLVDTPDFPVEYRAEALAHAEALEVLRALGGSTNWTYLSPAPMFPEGKPTGAYDIGLDSPAGNSISGEDYALALMDEVERPKHERKRFTVAARASS